MVFAKSFLARGATLVSCDISEKMMEKTKAKYEDSLNDYSIIPGNKHFIRTDMLTPIEDHSFDLEEEIKKHVQIETDRFVFGC